MLILLGIVVVLAAADAALTAALLIRTRRGTGDGPGAAVEPTDAVEDTRDTLDEGFENLMRFQVGGKTGFETWGEQRGH